MGLTYQGSKNKIFTDILEIIMADLGGENE